MPRTRSSRQRYLEAVVGDLGRVDVFMPGQHEGDGWLYVIRCRSCWAEEPETSRRGHQMPGKMQFRTSSTSDAVVAWLEHEAAYHASEGS